MKKWIAFLLCLSIMLLMGCGAESTGQETAAPTETTVPAPLPALSVGYGRVSIVPKNPVALSHTQQATYTGVFDKVYMTCVAITDSDGSTLLLLTADLSAHTEPLKNSVLRKVSAATGVPESNISYSVTHNHSGTAPSGPMVTVLEKAAVESAQLAMEDRCAAELYIGTTYPEGLSFIRHYKTADGYWVGDNYFSPTGTSGVEHAREPDKAMQLMRFDRAGRQSVMMVNWQAHGVYSYYMEHLCADFIGPFRTEVETQLDCLVAFFQGGAGNVNPLSNLGGKNVSERTLGGMLDYGKALAQYPIEANDSLTKVETGKVSVVNQVYTAKTRRDTSDYIMAVTEFKKAYEAGATESEACAASGGIVHGIHGANRVQWRADRPDEEEMPVSAAGIGSVGFIMAPYEMFDDSALAIKEGSPFDMTFILAYTNGGYGYIPSLPCYEHGCYEEETTYYAKGTAEELVTLYLDMLNRLER